MLTIAFQQPSYTVNETMTPLEVCVVIATPNSLDDGVTAVIQVDSMDGTATGIHITLIVPIIKAHICIIHHFWLHII